MSHSLPEKEETEHLDAGHVRLRGLLLRLYPPSVVVSCQAVLSFQICSNPLQATRVPSIQHRPATFQAGQADQQPHQVEEMEPLLRGDDNAL